MENKQKNTYTITLFKPVMTIDQKIEVLYNFLDAYRNVQEILPNEFNDLVCKTHQKIEELEYKKEMQEILFREGE